MMLYKDTNGIIRSPDINSEFFDVVVGVLPQDTLVPFHFIINQDYILRIHIDLKIENGLTLKRREADYISQTLSDMPTTQMI